MFTGIVEELGEVLALEGFPDDSARLTVRAPLVTSDAALGDSIAVSGVCLTVVALDGDAFAVEVMKESLDRSGLGALRAGSSVNLERALAADGRFGGHLVQGHVDATSTLLSQEVVAHWRRLRFVLPHELARYVVEKGSITVDGVSLTVAAVDDASFTVSLVPTTIEHTTLGALRPGDPVNLEVDVLAKYVAKLLAGVSARRAR